MPGVPGLKGDVGQSGVAGAPGKPGDIGMRGPQGRDGNPGPQGQPGQPGPRGYSGSDGKPGPMGSPGPAGPPGPPGETLGYDIAALTALLGQGQTKGVVDVQGDQPITDLTEEEKHTLVLKAYNHVKTTFEKLRKPDGQKSAPAKTCRDLYMAYPEFNSGEYWIDPNEGDAHDAILVFCDKSKRATCIMPQPKESKAISYRGDDEEVWIGEMKDGMKINYKTDSMQMSFLHLLSTKASQKIVFHCKNTVAYMDDDKHTAR